jgi:AcrR family transcriptional regulator
MSKAHVWLLGFPKGRDVGGNDVGHRRKTPRQRRSQATVEVILEAAAQLLERDGERGFNTNAVAERAGVSIGSLYRYFPNKQAILVALALREKQAFGVLAARRLAGDTEGLAPDRAVIRAFLQAFGGRTRARRIAVAALFASADAADLAADVHPPAFVDAEGRALSPIATFVLTRSLTGAMRAAVLEGADFLHSREFEDELVRLSRAYLGHTVGSRP